MFFRSTLLKVSFNYSSVEVEQMGEGKEKERKEKKENNEWKEGEECKGGFKSPPNAHLQPPVTLHSCPHPFPCPHLRAYHSHKCDSILFLVNVSNKMRIMSDFARKW
mmetsp:Transcript_24092/g.61092  ORF Transcript_24092/g.61092 Transcript_24092/m.61092 type:complete len:107 (+) Transcript_24092:3269-3589(+)